MSLTLPDLWQHLQRQLFPMLAEELGPLSELDEQFCLTVSVLDLGPLMRRFAWIQNGRPPHERTWMFHAFLAKSIYQFPTTEALIDALQTRPRLRQLCGWESAGEVPSSPTFSRGFTAFAGEQWAQRIHAEVIRRQVGSKLVGHVSRDATAIEAPERPAPKPAPAPAVPRKRGRPQQGQVRPPAPPKRLEVQGGRSLADNLADLPSACAVGGKRNSKGHQESWIGYKLHLDVIDGDIPVSAVLTGASVHDSQVAIPLAQMTAQRLTSLYDLMDSAYDAPQIHAFSRGLGHVPIIDPNPRRGEKIPLAPAQAQRFQERSAAERVNSRLKERYGGRWVRVRGAAKVGCHLAFGLLALTVSALLARLC
jgi:hypothetical protein